MEENSSFHNEYECYMYKCKANLYVCHHIIESKTCFYDITNATSNATPQTWNRFSILGLENKYTCCHFL